MFDNVPGTVRRRMARIRKIDTKPEMVVRRLVHRLGFRFRLHRRDLPGCPDLVFPRLRKAMFVHGCFWHRHDCSLAGRLPQTRTEYWLPKLARNVERDEQATAALLRAGWSVLTVWECETRDLAELQRTVDNFLKEDR